MASAVFVKATGQMRVWERAPDSPWDPDTEVRVECETILNALDHRWDGATGWRMATAAERSAYLAGQVDQAAQTTFDSQKAIKATNLYWLDVVTQLVAGLNQVRTNPTTAFAAVTAPTAAQVRQGVIDKYKAL